MKVNNSLLIQGDCLDKMINIPDNTVDLILTDPPYGTTACSWDSIIPLIPMWNQINRIIKSNGVIIIMGNEPYTSLLICSNLKNFKYRWIWKKNKSTGFLNAKKQPLRCIEDICVFYYNPCTYNPQKTTGSKPVNNYTKNTSDGDTMRKTKLGITGGGQTDRYPVNIIEIPVINNDGSSKEGKKQHPTQKPVDLMEYLIKTYTNEKDLVLDFAMGVGTVGVSCKNLNRYFIGIELNKKYFQIAKRKINE